MYRMQKKNCYIILIIKKKIVLILSQAKVSLKTKQKGFNFQAHSGYVG